MKRMLHPRAVRGISRRGMTLIEMLIAIALTLALMGSMFVFYFNVLSSRSRAIEHMRQQQAVNTLFGWLDNDLMTCVAGDPAQGAGLRGDQTSIRLLTRGVSTSVAQHGADDPEVFSDLQVAEYRFNSASKRIEGRRSVAKVDAAASQPMDGFASLEGTVHHMRLRYFDGKQWGDAFDSQQSKALPIAVEVAIWLNDFHAVENDESQQELSDGEVDQELSTFETGNDSPEVELSSLSEEMPLPDRVRIILIPDAQSVDANSDPSREGGIE